MRAIDQKKSYDLDSIRERLPLMEACCREGVIFRKIGNNLVAVCPFHEERTGSFTIHSRNCEKAHCYGCGWNGDLFDFWQTQRGVSFKEAVQQLASIVGITPAVDGLGFLHAIAPKIPLIDRSKTIKKLEKPPLPLLLDLTDTQVKQLAELRNLSPEGVRVVCRIGKLKACLWPQFQDSDGNWHPTKDAAMSWVITDPSGWLAQFRRFDARPYHLRKKGETPREIKAWTKGSPSWPIGAGNMGKRLGVLLVEGGADLLAAYHFLWGFDLLNKVAVVAMLGASNRIAKEARSEFCGKRVRIMMDADEFKGEGVKRKAAGMEAAARWQGQLSHAGAVVEVFSLYGLKTASGDLVKDLNDLALCSAGVIGSEEISDAFFDFDF